MPGHGSPTAIRSLPTRRPKPARHAQRARRRKHASTGSAAARRRSCHFPPCGIVRIPRSAVRNCRCSNVCSRHADSGCVPGAGGDAAGPGAGRCARRPRPRPGSDRRSGGRAAGSVAAVCARTGAVVGRRSWRWAWPSHRTSCSTAPWTRPGLIRCARRRCGRRRWRPGLPARARRRYARAVRGRAVTAVLADDGRSPSPDRACPRTRRRSRARASIDWRRQHSGPGIPAGPGRSPQTCTSACWTGGSTGCPRNRSSPRCYASHGPRTPAPTTPPTIKLPIFMPAATTLPTTLPATTVLTTPRREGLLPATQAHAGHHRPASRSGSAWRRSSGSTSGRARSPGSDPCCPGSPEISWHASSGGRSGASPSPVPTVTCSWPG